MPAERKDNRNAPLAGKAGSHGNALISIRHGRHMVPPWMPSRRLRFPPTPRRSCRSETCHLTVPATAGPVNILRGIDLDLGRGEAVGLVGPSGSGKTSLLMVLAGLERATSGSVRLAGRGGHRAGRGRAGPAAPRACWHRVPGIPPDPDHDGAGERRGAAGTGGRAPTPSTAPGRRCGRWGWATG